MKRIFLNGTTHKSLYKNNQRETHRDMSWWWGGGGLTYYALPHFKKPMKGDIYIERERRN